jgi:multidrug efflux system membrane fusion protein
MRAKGTVSPRIFRCMSLIACALSALLAGCEHGSAPVHSPIPVRVGAAVNFEQAGGLRYSANIEALTQVNLAFKSGGYVEYILQRKGADGRMRVLQVGDRVGTGETLARVRESEYSDKVTAAKAQVDQAQANYDKAKFDFERATNLYKSDSFTKAQLDSAKAAYDSGAASVESAMATWLQAKTAQADCSVRSPLTGWVLERNVEVGSLAGTGTQAFVLADTHLVKAVFGVPDTRVVNARLGAPQTITTISLPGEFHGRITAVSPSADPKSRVFSVEVTIPNVDGQLKPGMIATLVLGASRQSEEAVTVVPLSAVVRSSQQPNGFAVFVVSAQSGKSIAHEQLVEIGDTLGNMISVTKGLKVGEPIVVTGGTLIKDGDEVKVIP